MLQEVEESLLYTLKDYYINNTFKYIKQLDSGKYPHVKNKHTGNFIPLTDKVLQRHLAHKETIGIFCKSKTKFISFDVDTGSEEDMQYLHETLVNNFHIGNKNILTSISGGKGYHVDIFFNEPMTFELAEDFYYQVLLECNFDASEVELRPRMNIGVKLPLGLNRVTGVKCSFIDWYTLNELPDNTIQDIAKLERNKFIQDNKLTKGTHKQKYNTKIYNREINRDRIFSDLRKHNTLKNTKTLTDVIVSIDFEATNIRTVTDNIKRVLERGYFTPNDSYKRHDYTLLIAIYLKEQRVEQKATQNEINLIMQATRERYKDLIKSSQEFTEKETQRIVNLVYTRNYKLLGQQQEIYLTQDELLDMLSVEHKQQRRLYIAMIGHAKRFNRTDEVFCMTFETMRAMNIRNNGTTMKKNLKELEDKGYIEIVRGGEINKELLNSYDIVQRLPNIYRIKKSFNQNTDKKVLVKADASNSDPIELLTKAYNNNVIEINDIRKHLSKYHFRLLKQSL